MNITESTIQTTKIIVTAIILLFTKKFPNLMVSEFTIAKLGIKSNADDNNIAIRLFFINTEIKLIRDTAKIASIK